MEILTALIVGHFLGDFILQSNWMALNKSKSFIALAAHVAAYSLGLGAVMFLCFWAWAAFPEWQYRNLWRFIVVNGVLHFLIDAATSTLTSALWFVKPGWGAVDGEEREPILVFDSSKRHWFFVAIGFDQTLHYLLLVWLTFYYFY